MEADIFISHCLLKHLQSHTQNNKLSPFITQLTVSCTLILQQPLETSRGMKNQLFFLLMHLSVKASEV